MFTWIKGLKLKYKLLINYSWRVCFMPFDFWNSNMKDIFKTKYVFVSVSSYQGFYCWINIRNMFNSPVPATRFGENPSPVYKSSGYSCVTVRILFYLTMKWNPTAQFFESTALISHFIVNYDNHLTTQLGIRIITKRNKLLFL